MPLRFSIPLMFVLLTSGQAKGQDVSPTSSPVAKETYRHLETYPRFPGCEDLPTQNERHDCAERKLLEYVYGHVVYPEEARQHGREGRAIVSFMVAKDGKITEVTILRDPGCGLGEAAAQAVHQMIEDGIQWIPASARFRPVRVQYTLPVYFKLTDTNR